MVGIYTFSTPSILEIMNITGLSEGTERLSLTVLYCTARDNDRYGFDTKVATALLKRLIVLDEREGHRLLKPLPGNILVPRHSKQSDVFGCIVWWNH